MFSDANFSLHGKTALITGASGVLCSGLSRALAQAGVKVILMSRTESKLRQLASEIEAAGGEVIVTVCDVLDQPALLQAASVITSQCDRLDFLINGAGGNQMAATTRKDWPFFDLPKQALQGVFDLNLMGTLLPCQVFGRIMAAQGEGAILNITSMSALRPLTRVPAYSAAKAALSNFTQWLAVTMAQEYSPRIRVNALAPGFFITEQNRFLLLDEQDGSYTARGQKVIQHTPMGRLGQPEDLFGAAFWLLSPAAAFVTGIVVPVDGGFSAYSGV